MDHNCRNTEWFEIEKSTILRKVLPGLQYHNTFYQDMEQWGQIVDFQSRLEVLIQLEFYLWVGPSMFQTVDILHGHK